MRPLLLAALLLSTTRADAQCCCADHVLEVRTTGPAHGNGRWNHTARLVGDREPHARLDSVRGDPYLLRSVLPTGCGVEHATWELRDGRTGYVMEVHLYHLPGDAHLPDLRLPWTPGRSFHVDLRDVLACGAALGPLGDKTIIRETICRTGRVRITAEGGRLERFEPLDLDPWMREPVPPTRYTAAQDARFLDGDAGMQQYLAQQVDKALIAPLPNAITLTGHAMVEANGTVNDLQLDRTPYPALEEAVRSALLRSGRWRPAVVPRPSIPEGPPNFQAIRHAVPVRFLADPAAVGRTLSDFELGFRPMSPVSLDSLQLFFQWFAGSCGTYRDSVTVTAATIDRPWTDIAVGIGLVGQDCTDIAMRRRTITLPPLPAGRYRVRFGEAPAGTTPIRPPDPFAYREVVVR